MIPFSKRFILFLLGIFVLAAAAAPPAGAQKCDVLRQRHKTVRVGIVTDGSTPADQALVQLFKKELSAMGDKDLTISCCPQLVLAGNDNRQEVNRALEQLLRNPKVDIVLTLGIISSTAVLERDTPLPKPVVAPYIADFALKNRRRAEKSSGIKNLVYIDSMYYLDHDVEIFRKIVPFKHLAIILDRRTVAAFPRLDELARDFGNRHHLEVTIVKADQRADEVIANIPATADAAVVGPLWHFSPAESAKLARELTKNGIPGFAIWDNRQVREGLLAGLETASKQEIIARRTAVAVTDIINGEKPASIDVDFIRDRQLTINMATVRALNMSSASRATGIYPNLLTLTDANIINDQRTDIERHLDIRKAVAEAVAANLKLQSAATNIKAGQYAVREAQADLLPRIDLETGARALDDDRAKIGGGSNPERAWTGGAAGSILLYSEKKWANFRAEEHIQKSRESYWEKVRLDTMYQASVAYLNVLRAKTIERIYKDNLKLTKANLKRAQLKVATGAAGPDEVYRWQSKYANDRRQVLYRESDVLDSMQALNRILHRPLQELFVPDEATLEDPLFIVGNRFFFRLLENPYYLQRFKSFAVREALERRPELKEYDAVIQAKDRLKTAAKRERWLPDFTVDWKVEQYLAEDGSGQRDDSPLNDTDWNIGVYARLPIFEGGKKIARANRLQEEIRRLQIDRNAMAEAITQDVLAALNKTRASYPSITLSQMAAEAAKNNLQLVTDSYVEGIKSIIDLLDAQNQMLNANLGAANAVYNFLIDFMGVERAIGEFISYVPEDQRQEWLEKAQIAVGMPL
ncbi:MAG: TolC family protein [Deltaproteobacteria bacterium]|nr:TolC family protein [Deltaproteobacteria bacterium]